MRNIMLGTTYLRNVPDAPGAASAPVLEVLGAPPAPLPVVATAPEVVAPAAAVPAPAEPAAAPAAPAEPPAAIPEPVKADAPIDAHAEASLLEGAAVKPTDGEVKPGEPKAGDPKPAEAKPGEVKPDAKPVEAAPGAEPPAAELPPVYDFKLPETITADSARLDVYKGLLAEHKISPEVGQKLLDQYAESATAYAQHLQQEQHRTFAETRAGWRKEVQADPILGGAGHQTAMQAIAAVRDLAVPAKDRKSFDEALRITGAGDNPHILRAFHALSRYVLEPVVPKINGQPPANNGKAPGKRTLRSIYKENAEQRANS